MKKILILILLLTNYAMAKDYTYFCSANTAHKSLAGSVMSLTGVNSLTRNIIESQIAKAVKKETGAKFNIKINSFFASNIANGAFRDLSAKSDEYFYDGVALSNIEVKTFCPYNQIEYKDNTLYFIENMVLTYKAEISQKDLDKTVQSSAYKKIIDKMNSDEIISSLIKITTSSIEIKKDKLNLKYEITPVALANFIKPIKMNISAGLKVEDGKIQLVDMNLARSKKLASLLPLINKLNPLSYTVDVDKNNKGTLELNDVKIQDSKILLSGAILIPKNKQ